GLNLNTLIFSPRRCSTTCTETAPSSFERSVTTSSPPVIRTSGVNASPAACDCRSTRSFWPSSTRYCLPPILITAYMSRGMVPERRARSATQDLSQQATLALARVAAVAGGGNGGGRRLRGRGRCGLGVGGGRRLGGLLGRRPPPRPRLRGRSRIGVGGGRAVGRCRSRRLRPPAAAALAAPALLGRRLVAAVDRGCVD